MPEISSQTMQAVQIALLIVGAICFVADFVLLIVWLVSKSRQAEGAEPLFAPRWSLVDVFVGGQIIVLLIVIGSLVAQAIWLVSHPGAAKGLLIGSEKAAMQTSLRATLDTVIPTFVLQNLIMALVVFAYVKLRYRLGIGRFIFGERPLRAFLVGLAVAIPLVIALLGIQASPWLKSLSTALSHSRIGRSMEELQKLMDATWLVMRMVKTPRGFAWALLTIGIIGPVGEEIFFRGFLFNAVKHRFGLAAGLIVSSFLFAAIHIQVIYFALMFLIALVMAYVYERTRSLLAPMAIHIFNNSLAVILAYLAPNLIK